MHSNSVHPSSSDEEDRNTRNGLRNICVHRLTTNKHRPRQSNKIKRPPTARYSSCILSNRLITTIASIGIPTVPTSIDLHQIVSPCPFEEPTVLPGILVDGYIFRSWECLRYRPDTCVRFVDKFPFAHVHKCIECE